MASQKTPTGWPSAKESGSDRRSAKAQAKAKARKVYEKARRPWYRKKRFVIPLAVVVLLVVGSALSGGGNDTTTTARDDDTSSSPPAETTAPQEKPSQGSPPKPSAYERAFGAFATIEASGTGAQTITLPTGAQAGMATFTHHGSSDFVVTALGEHDEPTGELLVNAIGDYRGTTAYGLSELGGSAVKLQVEADGTWTARIAPLARAPVLRPEASGTGDAVFRYEGGPTDWTVTHDGTSNFAVAEYPIDDPLPNLMVNEIGRYQGSVQATEGPAVVTVNADGAWTILRQ
jgi:hypothetical protein